MQIDPFAVKDCALIAVATGEHVVTLRELKDKLGTIPTSCIYYHFWGGLLRPRFDDPLYQNDFAIWTWRGIHDKTLAERLAVIDPKGFKDLEELRRELIEVIEERLDENELLSWVIPSQRFHFVRSQIVVFDTGKRFSTIEELSEYIPHMSRGVIFYHLIDARRRTPLGRNDFTEWLMGYGEEHQELAMRIAGIDPYFTTLSELRNELHQVFSVYLRERRGRS
ncbi:MAG: DUF5752 family protein [Syntrophus sp. (in: bacteria)]|nr:DUF5752 family protein [Syntrophus sp. (in: bacteria)]